MESEKGKREFSPFSANKSYKRSRSKGQKIKRSSDTANNKRQIIFVTRNSSLIIPHPRSIQYLLYHPRSMSSPIIHPYHRVIIHIVHFTCFIISAATAILPTRFALSPSVGIEHRHHLTVAHFHPLARVKRMQPTNPGP